MAKKRNNDLIDRVRTAIPGTNRKRSRGRQTGLTGSAVNQVRSAFDALKGRVTSREADRSQAAKKAARTRKLKAERRSRAARKAARTRARAGSR